MTKEQYPTIPPPELVDNWLNQPDYTIKGVINKASQWGADQELEACCLLLDRCPHDGPMLHDVRRPKPLSIKEEALNAARIELDPSGKNGSLIIRALEALPDD